MTNIIQVEHLLAEIRELAQHERPESVERIGELMIEHGILDDLSEEVESLSEECDRADSKVMDLECENEELREQVKRLEAEAEELEKDKEFLSDVIAERREQITKLEKDLEGQQI